MKSGIQTEVDASYLYAVLASHEDDEAMASVFREMSEIERGHAMAFIRQQGLDEAVALRPSWRAKTIHLIGKVFGHEYILGVLLDTESGLARSALSSRKSQGQAPSGNETNHVRILRNILERSAEVGGEAVSRLEKRHRTVGGNAIRAAVLGGNDGLVSNFSLVMGVAGAASGQPEILLAGLAGLLAGALSMALGEWISVKSSQELYENQMKLEMQELELNPEGEMHELALIYRSKGIAPEQADEMARELVQDKDKAHAVLVREELGIQPEELKGSAMEAALSSFFLFAIGAVIPVLPFFFVGGLEGILWSALGSAAGLFLIGAGITLFTGRNVWFSGFRQVFFGLAAAAVTFGIGKIIGVTLAG